MRRILFLLPVLLLISCGKEEPAYVLTTKIETQLRAFRAKEKFVPKAWQSQGFVPAPKPVAQKLETVVNHVIDQLLQSKGTLTQSKIKAIVSAIFRRNRCI